MGVSDEPVSRVGRRQLRTWTHTAVLACIVATTALLVHARVLKYPFIQDDWIRIEEALTPNPLQTLLSEFSPLGKGEYRPLGAAYFFLVAMFHLDPRVTHGFALLLHMASSLLVVAVLLKITNDRIVGWIGGTLYAGASSIHMDPLLWASGIVDGASVVLMLLALWLFLKNRIWFSALAYVGALLFKEAVAFLPLVLWTIAASRQPQRAGKWKSIVPVLSNTWIFILILALYAGIKSAGISPLSLADDEPYALRLTGPHVLRNLLTYSKWGIETLFPSRHVSASSAACLLTIVMVVLVATTLTRGRGRHRDVPEGFTVLTVWLIGSLSVFFFLPNHVYKYYLTAALPALVALILSAIRVGSDRVRISTRVSAPLIVSLAGISVISSFVYFRDIDVHGLNQPYVEGTNDLIRRGTTVKLVRDGLLKTHPTLPPSALLVFKDVEVWSFGKDAGPRIWYHDPTIRVYNARDLVKESNGWVLRDPVENQRELFTKAPTRLVRLDCCPAFLFELTANGLVERQLD